MFNSLLNIIKDVVKITTAPIEIAIDSARLITKPVANVAEECVKEVKDILKDV